MSSACTRGTTPHPALHDTHLLPVLSVQGVLMKEADEARLMGLYTRRQSASDVLYSNCVPGKDSQ